MIQSLRACLMNVVKQTIQENMDQIRAMKTRKNQSLRACLMNVVKQTIQENMDQSRAMIWYVLTILSLLFCI
jgi:Asp-tRNA(Asn)/Glu-tRNA(Gln) amidotransferase B subunit